MNTDTLKIILNYAHNPNCVLVCKAWNAIMYDNTTKCEKCNKIIKICDKIIWKTKYTNICHTSKTFIKKQGNKICSLSHEFFVMISILKSINTNGYFEIGNESATFGSINDNVTTIIQFNQSILYLNMEEKHTFELDFNGIYDFKGLNTKSVIPIDLYITTKHNTITNFKKDNLVIKYNNNTYYGNGSIYQTDIPLINTNIKMPIITIEYIHLMTIITKENLKQIAHMSKISKLITIKCYNTKITFKNVSPKNKLKYVFPANKMYEKMEKYTIDIHDLLIFDRGGNIFIDFIDGKVCVFIPDKNTNLYAYITPL